MFQAVGVTKRHLGWLTGCRILPTSGVSYLNQAVVTCCRSCQNSWSSFCWECVHEIVFPHLQPPIISHESASRRKVGKSTCRKCWHVRRVFGRQLACLAHQHGQQPHPELWRICCATRKVLQLMSLAPRCMSGCLISLLSWPGFVGILGA